MKKYIMLLSIIAISCSTSQIINYNRTGNVSEINSTKDTITLLSTYSAENENKAFEFAIRNAFENLLFKGIPDSSQNLPLISNENKAMKQSESYLNDLLKQKSYQKFIVESYIDSSNKMKNATLTAAVVKIDVDKLRRNLEENKVIEKFGI